MKLRRILMQEHIVNHLNQIKLKNITNDGGNVDIFLNVDLINADR